MNTENIDLNKYPIPVGYRLADSLDMKRKHTPEDWMFFTPSREWMRCSGWLVQKQWTYLVPISKPKGGK